jgi:hypothetical protein
MHEFKVYCSLIYAFKLIHDKEVVGYVCSPRGYFSLATSEEVAQAKGYLSGAMDMLGQYHPIIKCDSLTYDDVYPEDEVDRTLPIYLI